MKQRASNEAHWASDTVVMTHAGRWDGKHSDDRQQRAGDSAAGPIAAAPEPPAPPADAPLPTDQP